MTQRLSNRVKALTLGQPDPANTVLEEAVLMACWESADAMGTVMDYLKAVDFFDPDNATRFAALLASFKAAGPKSHTPLEPLLAQCRQLRKLTATRHAREIAWKLVLDAHASTPTEWCKRAEQRLANFKEALERSKLDD